MRKLTLFIFLSIAALTACRKDRPVGEKEYVTLTYQQTYCADPWPTGSTDSATLKNVARYLDSAQLYIAGLSIKAEAPPEVCSACTCKTGKIIYVSTLNSETLKVKYEAIGFK